MDLLALNNSVEQHVQFISGSEPEKLQSFARASDGSNIHQRNKENIGSGLNKAQRSKALDQAGIDYEMRKPNILRTVYLENEDVSELRAELDKIQ